MDILTGSIWSRVCICLELLWGVGLWGLSEVGKWGLLTYRLGSRDGAWIAEIDRCSDGFLRRMTFVGLIRIC